MTEPGNFRLRHRLRVRWAEVDRQGIVFNGHYLTYFDVGLTEYWRATGLRYPEALLEAGSDLFVVKALVEYHQPALYDDEIDVAVRASRLGRTSLTFAVALFRGAERVTSGELVYVNADPVTRRSQPLPAFLRRALGAWEGWPGDVAPPASAGSVEDQIARRT